jgi:dTDP-glucose pyrophosphorylase
LIVIDPDDEFVGILSIGDIQRAIIKNQPLEYKISGILRKNPKIADIDTPLEQIKAEMLQYRMEFIPVIDGNNHIQEVYFWDELFIEKKIPPHKQFNLPVVIMAGGVGSRLKPLTNVLPKPLIPFGDKSIIEEIFDRFGAHGCKEFYISVNYKADLIEYYIKSKKHPFSIRFFHEEKPLGTAGSLYMLKDKIFGTFFVSNCDILIEQDYAEILDYHKENKNDITIVAALKHYPIPYGVIETGDDGELKVLQEKPEFTFKINSGMYILESNVLAAIPANTFFHITELIEKVHQKEGKIGVFPVSEKSWKDLGDWNEYYKTLSNVK